MEREGREGGRKEGRRRRAQQCFKFQVSGREKRSTEVIHRQYTKNTIKITTEKPKTKNTHRWTTTKTHKVHHQTQEKNTDNDTSTPPLISVSVTFFNHFCSITFAQSLFFQSFLNHFFSITFFQSFFFLITFFNHFFSSCVVEFLWYFVVFVSIVFLITFFGVGRSFFWCGEQCVYFACVCFCVSFSWCFFLCVCILMGFLHLSSQYSLCTVSIVVTGASESTVVFIRFHTFQRQLCCTVTGKAAAAVLAQDRVAPSGLEALRRLVRRWILSVEESAEPFCEKSWFQIGVNCKIFRRTRAVGGTGSPIRKEQIERNKDSSPWMKTSRQLHWKPSFQVSWNSILP